MNRCILFIASILLITATAQAQDLSISGTLKDSTGQGLSGIGVSLLRQQDSSWVRSVITGDKGEFQFGVLKADTYLLAVQAAGFKPLLQTVVVDKVVSVSLALIPVAQELNDVTVKAKKPLIESGPGKIVVNVEQQDAKTTGDALDLLRRSPGVQVENGSVTMKGVQVLVLIDDKQTYLSGQDLADYLRSLPADQVAQLELIAQPSSRYDAEGSGGIINIKTKRSRKKGWNGTASALYGQNVYGNTHASLNLSYRNNKWTAYANAGYLHATGFQGSDEERSISDVNTGAHISDVVQHSFLRETFSDYNLKLGTDYACTEKLTVGASIKGVYHPNDETDETHTMITDASGINNNDAYVARGLLRKNVVANAYAKWNPKKGQELTVDADYLLRTQTNYQDITSYDYNTQQITPIPDVRNQSPSRIEAMVMKADYTLELPKDAKLEAGLKSGFSSAENGAFFEVNDNGNWIPDTNRSNNFQYRENINAAYVTASKPFGKKWKAQLGLRLEQMLASGHQDVNDRSFDRNNTALFPTAFVSYTANDKNSFELNCGRRIQRPAYTQLNPFITYYSKYSYFTGNPELAPAYNYFGTFRYNLRNELFLSAEAEKVTDVITPVVGYDAATNATVATMKNYTDCSSLSVSANYTKKPFDWWQVSLSAGCYYSNFTEKDRKELLAAALGYWGSWDNEFVLKNGWSIDTTLSVGGGELQNLVDRYQFRYWAGMNVTKKVLKDAGTLRLGITDPFDGHRVASDVDYGGIKGSEVNRWGNQQVSVGFSYNLGKKPDSGQKHQSNVEEAGRM